MNLPAALFTPSWSAELELAYAPPFGSAKDPVNIAGYVATNVLNGSHEVITWRELRALDTANTVQLVDVRNPAGEFPVGSGRKRSGQRVLTVGTDCALGKKYTALALARALQALGAKASFRASGQTGIMIAGEGIAIDAVVADFISGGIEWLSPARDDGGWDLIEGQGSLFHPAYAGVTLALLHGTQPDVIVVCHEPGRTRMLGFPDFEIPAVEEVIDLAIRLGRRTNPGIRCAGLSLFR